MKHFIQLDIFKFVSTLEKVSFVETHVNKQIQEKKPETKETTTKPKETTTETKKTTPEQKTS